MSARTPPIRVIAGPTAVGKTAYGLKLAEDQPVEVISADSRQVYRQMTIGTAKPTPDELARVQHHFIDELDVGAPFSAGAFAHQANQRIADTLARGHQPIVVGGATLYLHALIHGLSPDLPSGAEVRAKLEDELADQGSEALYRELSKVDPQVASTMDHTKTARVMRALEVYRISGVPMSQYHASVEPPRFEYDVLVLTMDRARLYRRINRRVDSMLEAGLLQEVAGLLESGIDWQTPSLRTIGYQESIAHLKGEVTHAEMVRLIKRNSRRYAKRQLTWFRRYGEYRWVDVSNNLEDLSGAGALKAAAQTSPA